MAKGNKLRLFTDKLFGGLKMSWPAVIIFAVASAVVTSVFLIVPVFSKTSFIQMGTTFEAWILLAVIIIVNCEKALEAALKTFVFFLISQPLIYLFQVPFYDGGFEIFRYYPYWLIWTLLTFPMALVGWFLRKRNWISLFVLLPVIAALAVMGTVYAKETAFRFPHHLIAAVFCFGQIWLYLYAFFKDFKKHIAGLAVTAAAIVLTLLFSAPLYFYVGAALPDTPALSENAAINFDDSAYTAEQFLSSENYVSIRGSKFGSSVMTVTDGDEKYEYYVEFKYADGDDRVEISKLIR